MKYIVTGCSSYIAKYVINKLLGEGHQIVGISRSNPQIVHNSFRWISRDLSLALAVVDVEVDVIIHMAAQSLMDMSADEYVKKNIFITYNTKEMALCLRPKVIIYTSTIKVYGEIKDSRVTEKTDMINVGLYGMTKYLGEKILEESVPTISLRMPGVIAVGAHGWLDKIYHKLKNNVPVKIYNSPYNHVIHASDIFGIIKAVCGKNYFKNEAFNVCASSLSTSLEVISYISKVLDSKSTIEVIETEDRVTHVIANEKLRGLYIPLNVIDSIALYLDEMRGSWNG